MADKIKIWFANSVEGNGTVFDAKELADFINKEVKNSPTGCAMLQINKAKVV